VHKPEVISVGDFSDEELMEAARMHSADVFWRIEKALEPGVLRRTQSFGLSEDASLPVGVAAADEEIVESLKHPVMWGALLELEGSVQASALQGDPQAVRELSRVFVSRFCRKALQRGRTAGLDQLKLETVVRAVAVQSANNGRERQLYMDWIEAAHGTGFVNHFEAKTLYAEAMSAGLILEDDPQHWRWRHSWVPSCLAAISRA
jgi:hypothetical protein